MERFSRAIRAGTVAAFMLALAAVGFQVVRAQSPSAVAQDVAGQRLAVAADRSAGDAVDSPAPGRTPTNTAAADDAAGEAGTGKSAASAKAPAAKAGAGQGSVTRRQTYGKFQKTAPTDKKAAAKRAADLRLKSAVSRVTMAAATGAPLAPLVAASAPLPGIEGPGGVPHYFGPYGNWAFSPLPRGGIAQVTIVDGGTGYKNPLIVIDDAHGTGASIVVPTTQVGGVVQAPTIGAPVGSNFTAPVATVIDDPARCGGALPACGTGALADALVGGPVIGGIRKFVDKLPGLGPNAQNALGQFIPVAVPTPWPFGCTGTACTSDYYEIALVEYSEKMHSDLPATRLRGYVQIVPQGWTGTDALGNRYSAVALTTANGLTQNISIGGAQAYGATKPHYLGPLIVAKGRNHGVAGVAGTQKAARIKFYNLLPTGAGGDLFLPVDESIPGSGLGPNGGKYTQNRATVHLHGNNTVWISDGNTHQWITPANENTPYPAGVSARSVPDMTGCDAGGRTTTNVLPGNGGCMTFYYSNAQSARLQFYHDHAMGITRLNVYAGEAAGYLITDQVETDLIAGTNVSGVNPNNLKVLPGLGIPLVIQDRTFVDASTVFAQDPTWNWGTGARSGGKITAAVTGDLWYPHVYMTVQNPWDLSGTNGLGRWHYGPWFNPPTPTCVNGLPVGCIETGPVPNEYYDPINHPWEPPMRPGVPNPSLPGESFLDTQLVNGTAYPYVEVEPKAVRFRILNASNDRFLNLQLYVAADKKSPTTPGSVAVPCNGGVPVGDCTEVAMVPVSVMPVNQYADTPSGIPDPLTAGPPWLQIGTEGGFMPKPIVVPQTPVGYNLDPAYFNFGIVNQHSLFLGAAERADVIVDLSAYAGKTLILYNDSPAPVPAGAAPYDFFTGDGNGMAGGGAPNTLPGYGPNTRTVMQIRVGTAVTTPTTDVTLPNLETVWAKTATKRGVFEVSQDPIIVPQSIYDSAYNTTFPTDAVFQHNKVGDSQLTFQPIDKDGIQQPALTMPLEMKAMHDEMGGVYETMYGRMSGMLGVALLNSPNHVLVPYGFGAPPTDLVKGSTELTPVGVLRDGTQIWRIFHNGVDTHPIHFHLFTAQLINRVGQDGQIVGDPVDPIDQGWKDTIKINPLEITFVALRPTVPSASQIPFEVGDSIRLIDPTLPANAPLPQPAPAGWFDPFGTQIPTITNHLVNFGWEYVWHCHILSHEEMDFMHSLVFAMPPTDVTDLAASANRTSVTLTWTDKSSKELQYRVERATDPAFTSGLATFTATNTATTGAMSFRQNVTNNRAYWYRVWAVGPTVGDVGTPGFPTMSAESVSNVVAVTVGTLPTPAAPIGLSATWPVGTPPRVNLSWTDSASNETHYAIERCAGTNCGNVVTNFAALPATAPAVAGTGSVGTFTDATVVAGTVYSYRVKAMNGTVSSAYSNIAANIADSGIPAVPAAPTSLTVTITTAGAVTLNWAQTGLGVVDFTIQRATNATFTAGLATLTAAAGATTASDTVGTTGTFYYRIRANGSGGSSAWTNGAPFPQAPGGALPPVVISSLSADVAFPAAAGTPIVFTAIASGGTPPLEYAFWRYSAATGWVNVQAYGTQNTYTWTPTVAEAGSYVMAVWVRSVGSAASYDAVLGGSWFDVYAPGGTPVISSLTANVTFPVNAGTSVTWTATAVGGTAPLQYAFWQYSASTGWVLMQPYGPSNTFTSSPLAGVYYVAVWVLGAGSTASYDAVLGSQAFSINAGAPVTITSLTANGSSAQAPITWTATATGGAGSLEYQFWWYTAATGWTIVQPYGASNTYTLNNPPAGTYALAVWARSAGLTVDFEAFLGTGFFTITP